MQKDSPFDFFDKIFYINLAHRKDRFEYMQLCLKDAEIVNAERFNAVYNHIEGWKGCKDSHLAILKQCYNTGVEKFLILEDDIIFVNNPQEHLSKSTSQLPVAWDLLYLGANIHNYLHKYSDNLHFLKHAYSNHAIAYNNKRVVKYILDNIPETEKIDIYYQKVIQEKFNCYLCNPFLATQAESFSDVEKKKQDTKYILERADKFLRK